MTEHAFPGEADREAAFEAYNRAWDWFGGMVCISAVNLGIRLGIFDAIRGSGPYSAAELADRLSLHRPAIEVWAAALVHYGVLRPAGDDRVALAPGIELLVCEPRTLLNLAPSFDYHGRFLARDFLDLESFLRDGQPKPPGRHGTELAVNVAEQTAGMQTLFAEVVVGEVSELAQRLTRGSAVLDAGCGTGRLCLALASAHPASTFTGIDVDPAVVDIARAAAGVAGCGERVRFETQAIAELDEGRYELAILFLVLHEIAVGDRAASLAALRRSLRPGGLLVLVDEQFPPTLEAARERSARSAIHFAYTELLWGSHVPTPAQVDGLLKEAGFDTIRRVPVLDGGFELVLAEAL